MIRRMVGLTIVSLALAAAASAARADGEPFQVLGKVKKADGGGAAPFELTARGGPYEVVLGAEVEMVDHRAVAFSAVEQGRRIHVLARKGGRFTDPDTGARMPARIFSVIAIVVGEGFVPPAVPADLAAKGLVWHSGTFGRSDAYTNVLDGQYLIEYGRDAKVVVVQAAGPAAIAKGKILHVEGTLDRDVKPKRLTASRVVLVDPTLTADQVRVVLGDPGVRAARK